jgi:hypothetical protein
MISKPGLPLKLWQLLSLILAVVRPYDVQEMLSKNLQAIDKSAFELRLYRMQKSLSEIIATETELRARIMELEAEINSNQPLQIQVHSITMEAFTSFLDRKCLYFHYYYRKAFS